MAPSVRSPRPDACSGWAQHRRGSLNGGAESVDRGDDAEELPESRRHTPVKDGIQTASKAPARLADGLEVEGPPPVRPDMPLASRRLAHWFPRSAPWDADSASSSIRPAAEARQRATIHPSAADFTTSERPGGGRQPRTRSVRDNRTKPARSLTLVNVVMNGFATVMPSAVGS